MGRLATLTGIALIWALRACRGRTAVTGCARSATRLGIGWDQLTWARTLGWTDG